MVQISVLGSSSLQKQADFAREWEISGFKHGNPTFGWLECLYKRHPELTTRKPEKLGTARASMLNSEVVSRYFKDLSDLMVKLKLSDKPSSIWNCDETGKQLSHEPIRVLAKKGTKNVVGRTSNDRTNITIMACANAAGKKMPPMLVVKGKTRKCLDAYNVSAAPPGTYWSFQEKAWMTDEIGELWFKQVFLPNCGGQRPQLLILDGHSSHETFALLELAESQNIHIISLPPHTTHALQPLDKAVFGPFNRAYNKACSEYLSASPVNAVNKWTFPHLFKLAWDEGVTVQNVKSGFSACGIYPLNPGAVTQSLFLPSEPTDRPLSSVPSLDLPSSSPSSDICVEDRAAAHIMSTICKSNIGQTSLSELPVSLSAAGNSAKVPDANSEAWLTSPVTLSSPPVATSHCLSQDLPSPATVVDFLGPSTSTSFNSEVDYATMTLSTLNAIEKQASPTNFATEVDDYDLENPSLLLDLINTGKLEVVAEGNQSGIADLSFRAELDSENAVELPNSDLAVKVSTEVSAAPNNIWQKEVDDIFLPPKITSPRESSTKKGKKNTGHRILTSKEVLEEKRNQAETKIKLQNEKERRKRLRDQKRNESQTKRLKNEMV